jgi:hypothetical protein
MHNITKGRVPALGKPHFHGGRQNSSMIVKAPEQPVDCRDQRIDIAEYVFNSMSLAIVHSPAIRAA